MSLGYVGGVRRIEADFENAAGVLTDPATITFEITEPGQAEQSFTWSGVDLATIKRDTARGPTGLFYVDWPLTREGTHTFKWKSTGAVAAAAAGAFVVADTPQD